MIICGIASTPARVNNLKIVLKSISSQVDRVYVALNGHTSIPEWASEFDNVYFELFDNSRGDSMKFVQAYSKGNYYLALDDDLVVPTGYSDHLCESVDRYDGLVSLHGRKYPTPYAGFKRWVGNYRCLGAVSEDVYVNLVGSGCCAFHTDRLRVTLDAFKRPNMADVFLSLLASLQGVPMIVLKHDIGYLKYLQPPDSTIWQKTRDYSFHDQIMRSFIK